MKKKNNEILTNHLEEARKEFHKHGYSIFEFAASLSVYLGAFMSSVGETIAEENKIDK